MGMVSYMIQLYRTACKIKIWSWLHIDKIFMNQAIAQDIIGRLIKNNAIIYAVLTPRRITPDAHEY